MSVEIEQQAQVEHVAAKRCPHYDDECKDVVNHVGCWSHTDDPLTVSPDEKVEIIKQQGEG